MEICLAEAMKKIRLLNDQKSNILIEESKHCETTFRQPEEKIVYDYNFQETRSRISNINSQIIKLKNKINKINNETILEGFDFTISEGLIRIALINSEINNYLEYMQCKEQITSRVDMRNDGITYTELLYNPKECKEYVTNQKETLAKIQLAIDRANLLTMIECE